MEFIGFDDLDKNKKWVKFVPFTTDLDKNNKIFYKSKDVILWLNLHQYKMVEYDKLNNLYEISDDGPTLIGKFIHDPY